MYLCQQLTGESQKEITEYSNLKSTGSVSYTTHNIRVKIIEDKNFAKDINRITEKVKRKVV
jgi:chromosomal replication initiation ATPase DnaA